MNRTPLVSVCIITYNHECYIKDCIDSILNQKTDFEYEIVIGDDCSTDSTVQILKEYQNKYPQKIKCIINDSKIGGTENYIRTHLTASGMFVAHLDGDDIALEGKLQEQVNILRSRSDVGLVWHMMKIFDDYGHTTGYTHKNMSNVLDTQNIILQDLMRYGSLGAASSVMYRRELASYLDSVQGDKLDFYFAARILEKSKGYRIDQVLGGYRLNLHATTLSKNKRKYFVKLPMACLYSKNLTEIYDRNPYCGDALFCNSVFNALIGLRYFRSDALKFLRISWKTFTIRNVFALPGYFIRAKKIRRRT